MGCKFSDKIIYPETFAANPDSKDPVYSTEYGVYSPHCGLENVMLSWGHDEVRTAPQSPRLHISSGPDADTAAVRDSTCTTS